MEGRPLQQPVVPCLDVGVLVDVDAAPLGRVRVDESCNVGDREAVPGNEWGVRLAGMPESDDAHFRDRHGKEKTHKLLVQNMVEPSGLSRVPPRPVRYVFGCVTVEVGGLSHHGPIACHLP